MGHGSFALVGPSSHNGIVRALEISFVYVKKILFHFVIL